MINPALNASLACLGWINGLGDMNYMVLSCVTNGRPFIDALHACTYINHSPPSASQSPLGGGLYIPSLRSGGGSLRSPPSAAAYVVANLKLMYECVCPGQEIIFSKIFEKKLQFLPHAAATLSRHDVGHWDESCLVSGGAA